MKTLRMYGKQIGLCRRAVLSYASHYLLSCSKRDKKVDMFLFCGIRGRYAIQHKDEIRNANGNNVDIRMAFPIHRRVVLSLGAGRIICSRVKLIRFRGYAQLPHTRTLLQTASSAATTSCYAALLAAISVSRMFLASAVFLKVAYFPFQGFTFQVQNLPKMKNPQKMNNNIA